MLIASKVHIQTQVATIPVPLNSTFSMFCLLVINEPHPVREPSKENLTRCTNRVLPNATIGYSQTQKEAGIVQLFISPPRLLYKVPKRAHPFKVILNLNAVYTFQLKATSPADSTSLFSSSLPIVPAKILKDFDIPFPTGHLNDPGTANCVSHRLKSIFIRLLRFILYVVFSNALYYFHVSHGPCRMFTIHHRQPIRKYRDLHFLPVKLVLSGKIYFPFLDYCMLKRNLCCVPSARKL